MRVLRPLLPTLLLVAAIPAAAQDTEEWERDVAALAPGEETASTLILDARTRQPVPGARLTWYAEMEGLRAPALGSGVADAFGIASLDWTEVSTWDADGHFVVTAQGYAAAHDYGTRPPEMMELERGRDVHARLVDLLGRPVTDADVEVFLGCGHGPILDFVRTDEEGRFSVPGQDVDEAILWVEHPGTQADYLELSDGAGLGAGERTLFLAPGGLAEGIVLDSAGRPLEGVEVRSYQAHRGPVVMTDRLGRFRLVGVEHEASLYLAHPQSFDGRWAILDGDRWRPGTPMRLHLTPWGLAAPTQERVTIDVRGGGEDVVLLGDEDGLAYLPDDTEAEGVATFVVPPGVYVPAPYDPVAGPAFEPLPIDARVGARMRVTVRAEDDRVALRIAGHIPDGAETRVAVPGAELTSLEELLSDDPGRTEPLLPRDGPVVVSVELLGRVWFFPAGPVRDRVREVRVDVPAPHRVRVPEAIHGDLELLHQGRPCLIEETAGGLRTYASGNLVLVAETAYARFRMPLTLPEETRPHSVVQLEAPESEQLRTLRMLFPPGFDEWASVSITPESGGGWDIHANIDGPVERPIDGPAWVRVERDDHVVWTRRVEGPGDVQVEWGDAALSFHVVDEGGDHVRTTVVVDGIVVPQRDPDDFSVVRVLGLTPGPHNVVLLPHDDWFYAKELRVVLEPGEIRRKRVQLTPR